MAEAEEEGFSNYRVVNCHFQLNTQASTSPSPNMPPKAYETPADLAQAAKDYGGENRCLTSPKLGVLDILKNN
ncbi:hypothetical protein PROFUN_14917 [Planoprotostelium fungivorum]|uniref:Uncharacterized protein n=1 Tax=Planoprotostelium fungivorum TaxID=1890364 RepID=A0A2P6MY49_9EUKA|nr:hypothetical protein PROFUN_14917 [Planoprotostelium fungivorum]